MTLTRTQQRQLALLDIAYRLGRFTLADVGEARSVFEMLRANEWIKPLARTMWCLTDAGRQAHARLVELSRGGRTQSQESLTDQLRELVLLANRSGLYDAADWVKRQLEVG